MHYSTTHHSSTTTHPSSQGCTIASTPKRKKFNITERGAEELAPLLGSGPLSRWARGPLSVPCRPDTSTYCAIPHPASLPRWALGLPHVQWLRTPSPYQGGLWCRACVPWLRTLLPIRDGSGDTLPPCREGSDATMRPAIPCGPWDSSIKEPSYHGPMWLGLRVYKACTHVSKVPDVRASIGLQDVRAGNAFNACKTYKHASTV
jgi:hypothetical protein